MKDLLKRLWNKLFKKGPLYTEREIEFFGQKTKMQVYSKKRILESIEAAPSGSLMFTSPRTFIAIYHVDLPSADESPECYGNCENCSEFLGYGEGENGC